jgi:hypothetical protein
VLLWICFLRRFALVLSMSRHNSQLKIFTLLGTKYDQTRPILAFVSCEDRAAEASREGKLNPSMRIRTFNELVILTSYKTKQSD